LKFRRTEIRNKEQPEPTAQKLPAGTRTIHIYKILISVPQLAVPSVVLALSRLSLRTEESNSKTTNPFCAILISYREGPTSMPALPDTPIPFLHSLK
jgi:hypothetical protein